MMKNPFLRNLRNKFQNIKKPLFWAAFHILILISFAILFFVRTARGEKNLVNTNLFDILPDSAGIKAVSKADKVLTDRSGRQFIIFAEAGEAKKAQNMAAALYDALIKADSKKEIFERITLAGISGGGNEASGGLEALLDFYSQNRFLLLDYKTIDKLNETGGAEEIAQAALEKAYGAFSITPMQDMETDPFFLTELELENLIGLAPKTKSELDGRFYAMIQGSLTGAGAAITNKKSGVRLIYECAESILNAADDSEADFVFSGVPFHSYGSSSKAQKEVAVISALSMLAVIALLFFVFRSVLPIIFSIAAIALSALMGLCSTLIFFGQIHILTFVFGTTLIGTCLDYSVHFFIKWNCVCDKEAERKKMFKGFALSFLSTEICYLILFFAPFLLLKQIAIFSFCGILSTFLTVILLFPSIANIKKIFSYAQNDAKSTENNIKNSKICAKNDKILQNSAQNGINSAQKSYRKNIANLRYIFIATVATALFFIAIFYRNNLRLDNDFRKFYSMSGKLLEDEKKSAVLMARNSSPWYFIVAAQSKDALFLAEENFCRRLDSEIQRGRLKSYSAYTQFIPSPKRQRASFNACKNLFPLVEEQLLNLGFEQDSAALFFDEYKREGQIDFVKPPEEMARALSAFLIGNIDGKWFSVIMPVVPAAENAAASFADDTEYFKALCSSEENVFFINKMNDINFEMNRLTKIMLLLLAAAFVVLLFVLKIFYPLKTLARIAFIPLAVLLAEAAGMAFFKIPLGFFSVTGIILVFGLGMDYIIYTVESGDRLNRLAILISFLTTALSFGAIALSSFMPVHVFGSVVFIGLLAAWAFSRA